MRIVILVVLMMLLAGCAVSEGEECGAEKCEEKSDGESDGEGPGGSGVEPPIGATLGSIHLEECRGAAMGLDVPADTVIDDVPDAFGPASAIPFMANLGLYVISCSRIVAFNETFADVGILWTYLGVVPKNGTWGKGGFSFYSLDVLVTNESFAARLNEAGVDTRAATLELSKTAAQGLSGETWMFEAEESSFKIVFPDDGEPSGAVLERTFYFWSGDGPFHRTVANVSDESSQAFHIAAGTVETTGESGFRQAAGADRLTVEATSFVAIRWDISGRASEYSQET